MASFEDAVQEIRTRTDIVEIIRKDVSLKKAGASYKACCPFHKEKTPSFHVHPHRQFYYCFGCGAKGDVFTYLMETQHKKFGEVVKDLADQYGIVLPQQAPPTDAER
ncbi:MAG: CHC2 zinc finger domain-containing protein, partial [Myxococcota bacterium]